MCMCVCLFEVIPLYTWQVKFLTLLIFEILTEVEIVVHPSRLIEKMDILGHLPWAIRMIIKTFIARPYHYQW
jgi:hypothetical protein